jgi:hypothetical protein
MTTSQTTIEIRITNKVPKNEVGAKVKTINGVAFTT